MSLSRDNLQLQQQLLLCFFEEFYFVLFKNVILAQRLPSKLELLHTWKVHTVCLCFSLSLSLWSFYINVDRHHHHGTSCTVHHHNDFSLALCLALNGLFSLWLAVWMCRFFGHLHFHNHLLRLYSLTLISSLLFNFSDSTVCDLWSRIVRWEDVFFMYLGNGFNS